MLEKLLKCFIINALVYGAKFARPSNIIENLELVVSRVK